MPSSTRNWRHLFKNSTKSATILHKVRFSITSMSFSLSKDESGNDSEQSHPSYPYLSALRCLQDQRFPCR
jgi:hypothetical protein